jgi:flagellin
MFSPNQTTEGVTQMARIVTNNSAITAYKNYSRANVGLASSAEKLATGLRINRASDDAAGLAISEMMRGQIKATNMEIQNNRNLDSAYNAADGYYQNVSDILGRMEELAVEYTDTTMSATDKANLGKEFTALQGKITSIASATYNGSSIWTMVGVAAGTSSATIGGGAAAVQAEITTLSGLRADLGAKQSVGNYSLIGLENYAENLSAAEGRIRNTDMAKETTNFSKFQILQQSGVAMLGQANAAPQSVLRLLG